MTRHAIPIASLLAVMLLAMSFAAAAGPEEDAASSYARGNELLASADFEGALRAFAVAVKTDPAKREYLERFALVRQVLLMRRALGDESNPQAWETTARGLHKFYIENGILEEALALDTRLHAKLGNADSATLLAETLLALERDGEAAGVLGAIARDEATPRSNVLLALALARQSRADEASAIAARVAVPAEPDPVLFFDLARFHGRLGHTGDACGLLTRFFESTPPSELAAARARARACRDFAALAPCVEFEAALLTESKVAQSSCSGGASCGSCSMKGSCDMKKTGGACEMGKEGSEAPKPPEGSSRTK